MLLGFIIIFIIISLLSEAYIFLHKKYVQKEVAILNKNAQKAAEFSNKEPKIFKFEEVYSRVTDIIFAVSFILAEILVFFILNQSYDFLKYLKDTIFYGFIFFLSYLNIRIVITNIKRTILNFKGEL